jgi:hypothetical protein
MCSIYRPILCFYTPFGGYNVLLPLWRLQFSLRWIRFAITCNLRSAQLRSENCVKFIKWSWKLFLQLLTLWQTATRIVSEDTHFHIPIIALKSPTAKRIRCVQQITGANTVTSPDTRLMFCWSKIVISPFNISTEIASSDTCTYIHIRNNMR